LATIALKTASAERWGVATRAGIGVAAEDVAFETLALKRAIGKGRAFLSAAACGGVDEAAGVGVEWFVARDSVVLATVLMVSTAVKGDASDAKDGDEMEGADANEDVREGVFAKAWKSALGR
jgi:hypothetical protein